MHMSHKIIALDLKNATVKNLTIGLPQLILLKQILPKILSDVAFWDKKSKIQCAIFS